MAGPPRMGSQTAIWRQVVRLVSFGAAATQKARRIRKPVRYVGGPSGTLWRKAVGPFLSMWINARRAEDSSLRCGVCPGPRGWEGRRPSSRSGRVVPSGLARPVSCAGLCGGVSGRGLHRVDLANVVNTMQPMEGDPLRYRERPEHRMRKRAVRHAQGLQRRQQSPGVIEEAIQAPAEFIDGLSLVLRGLLTHRPHPGYLRQGSGQSGQFGDPLDQAALAEHEVTDDLLRRPFLALA